MKYLNIEEIEDIEKKIDYVFNNKDLISKVFIHKSIDYINNNTKYELLGDKIINLYIMVNIFDICNNADMLHNNYKNLISNSIFSKGFNYELRKYIKCTDIVRNNFKDNCKIDANIFECLIAIIMII